MSGEIAILIAAGGSGQRFGRAGGKQLVEVEGAPLLSWTLDALAETGCDRWVVVCDPERISEFTSVARGALGAAVALDVVAGGDSRQASVHAGLLALGAFEGVVVVHDGARPLVTSSVVEDAVELLLGSGAQGVVVGHPCYDTLKQVDGTTVVSTPDRARYWVAQTPQVFNASALLDAYSAAQRESFQATDDASLVERNGGTVLMFEGPRDNIKVTTPEDAEFVTNAIAMRRKDASS